MHHSRKNLGYTAEDHAAFHRRPSATLASWKRDAHSDDEIIRKFASEHKTNRNIANVLPDPSIKEVMEIKKKDIFSFRAESALQLEQLEWFCKRAGRALSISSKRYEGSSTVDVEIETHATIGSLQFFMRQVNMENLMLRTLKQCRLAENHFEESPAGF